MLKKLEDLGKLLKSPLLSYKKASVQNRRNLVEIISENLFLDDGKLILHRKTPFDVVVERDVLQKGGDNGT